MCAQAKVPRRRRSAGAEGHAHNQFESTGGDRAHLLDTDYRQTTPTRDERDNDGRGFEFHRTDRPSQILLRARRKVQREAALR